MEWSILGYREHIYRDLILKFLSTLDFDVTSGPCHECYIFFYLTVKFYELTFSAFNAIFCFPPSLDVSYHHVPQEFNPYSFWYEIVGDRGYDSSLEFAE